jgi:hypothetical protein
LTDRFRFSAHLQRAIIGWLVVHPAIEQHDEVAERDTFGEECFVGIEQWLASRCTQEIAAAGDKTPVDAFLRSLVDNLAREVETRVDRRDTETKAAFAGLVAHVRAQVAAYLSSPQDPIAQLDGWAREVTASCYQGQPDTRIAQEIETRLDEVETAVIAASGAPPEALPPWLVYACTRFPVNRRPPWRVELTLGVPLDSKSWLATGYVLLHELISHAAQGSWTGSCFEPAPDDCFAEGWMDLVAHILHGIHVYGGGEPAGLDQPRLRAMAADSLYLDRSLVRGRGTHGRRHGYEVANMLHRHLLGQGGGVDETFLRLSLHLNASSASHRRRQSFVFGVEAACALGAPIDEWVRDYGVDGELEKLLARVEDAIREHGAGRGMPRD